MIMSLFSCYSRYVEPKSGPVASILFVKHTEHNSSVNSYINAENCSGGRPRVLTPHDTKDIKLNVPAGKAFSFSMSADLGISISPTVTSGGAGAKVNFQGCNPTVTFIPKEGEAYIARFIPPTKFKGCQIEVVKQVTTESGIVEKSVEIRLRRWKRGFVESSSWCD